MEIGVCLPHYGMAMNPSGTRIFAERVEALGFDSLWVTDHVIVPNHLDIVYKERMLDPLATLNYLAAVTTRVKLGTSVIILPYRNPVTTAKEIATADVLSEGRVIFGAASGWMEGEFDALGVDFESRGAVSDEHLEVIRALWATSTPTVKTEHFDIRDVTASPAPTQVGGPPIWIGGQSRPAVRRAVKFGDAWHPNLQSWEDVKSAATYLSQASASGGRETPPMLTMRASVNFDAEASVGARPGFWGTVDQMVATAKLYHASGVSHVLLTWRDMPFTDMLAEVERFGEEVLVAAR